MKFNLKARIDDKISKLLYGLMVGYHHEDYVDTDKNGNIVRTPAHIWHANALANNQQR